MIDRKLPFAASKKDETEIIVLLPLPQSVYFKPNPGWLCRVENTTILGMGDSQRNQLHIRGVQNEIIFKGTYVKILNMYP